MQFLINFDIKHPSILLSVVHYIVDTSSNKIYNRVGDIERLYYFVFVTLLVVLRKTAAYHLEMRRIYTREDMLRLTRPSLPRCCHAMFYRDNYILPYPIRHIHVASQHRHL